MKYFTRELHTWMQEDDFSLATWENIVNLYRLHKDSILPNLPTNVRRLANSVFHDCLVKGFVFKDKDQVELELSGRRHSWLNDRWTDGTHYLRFKGVIASNLSTESLNDYWSYEEIDIAEGKPELRVLLADSQFFIRFTGFTLRTEPPNKSAQVIP